MTEWVESAHEPVPVPVKVLPNPVVRPVSPVLVLWVESLWCSFQYPHDHWEIV